MGQANNAPVVRSAYEAKWRSNGTEIALFPTLLSIK